MKLQRIAKIIETRFYYFQKQARNRHKVRLLYIMPAAHFDIIIIKTKDDLFSQWKQAASYFFTMDFNYDASKYHKYNQIRKNAEPQRLCRYVNQNEA